MTSERRREAFRRIVTSGMTPGILAYVGGQPAAWCAVAPREAHPALERSPVLARIDDAPVWSIVCLFVGRAFRRRGLVLPLNSCGGGACAVWWRAHRRGVSQRGGGLYACLVETLERSGRSSSLQRFDVPTFQQESAG